MGNRLPISPWWIYIIIERPCAVKVPTRWGYQGPRVLRGESDPEPDRSVACVIAGLAESFWTEDKASSQGPRQTVHATVIWLSTLCYRETEGEKGKKRTREAVREESYTCETD